MRKNKEKQFKNTSYKKSSCELHVEEGNDLLIIIRESYSSKEL